MSVLSKRVRGLRQHGQERMKMCGKYRRCRIVTWVSEVVEDRMCTALYLLQKDSQSAERQLLPPSVEHPVFLLLAHFTALVLYLPPQATLLLWLGSSSVSERPPSSDIPQMFHLICLVWLVILNATRAKTGSNKLKPHLLMRQACVGLLPGVKIWKGFSFWISISSDNPIKEKIY